MQIIAPTYITDSTLLYCDIPAVDPDYFEWDSATTYITGQRVVVNYLEDGVTPAYHKVYECTWHGGGNIDMYPPTHLGIESGYVWWELISSTNRWRLFDNIVAPFRAVLEANVIPTIWDTGNSWQPSTAWDISSYAQMRVDVAPGDIDSVAVLNTDCTSLSIIMDDPVFGEVYNENKVSSVVSAYNGVFQDLLSYPNATVTVLIKNSITDVACGEIIFGKSREIGSAKYGIDVGIIDYSAKSDRDVFGNYNLVERAFSKRIGVNFTMPVATHSSILRLLQSYRATPLTWIVSDLYSTTILYGFYRDLQVSITHPNLAEGSVTIEGLGADYVHAEVPVDPWIPVWDGIIHLTVPDMFTLLTISVPVLTKIEEAPVVMDTIAMTVPAVPSVAVSAGTYDFVGAAAISHAAPGVVTFTGHGLADDEEVLFLATSLLTLDVAPGGAGWAIGDRIAGNTSGATCRVAEVLTTTTYSVYFVSGTFTSGEILTNGTATADQGLGYPTVTAYTIPLPLVYGTHYFVMYDDANSFRLSLTVAGSSIDTTTDGTGKHTLMAQ